MPIWIVYSDIVIYICVHCVKTVFNTIISLRGEFRPSKQYSSLNWLNNKHGDREKTIRDILNVDIKLNGP